MSAPSLPDLSRLYERTLGEVSADYMEKYQRFLDSPLEMSAQNIENFTRRSLDDTYFHEETKDLSTEESYTIKQMAKRYEQSIPKAVDLYHDIQEKVGGNEMSTLERTLLEEFKRQR